MGSTSIPSPPPAPPTPPSVQDTAVQQAAADAARKRRLAHGYRSTILTQLFGGPAPASPSPGQQQTLGS